MNESAFPHPNGTSQGLTKLEYFAALAMQGLVSRGSDLYARQVAEEAVEYARALEKKLNEFQYQ